MITTVNLPLRQFDSSAHCGFLCSLHYAGWLFFDPNVFSVNPFSALNLMAYQTTPLVSAKEMGVMPDVPVWSSHLFLGYAGTATSACLVKRTDHRMCGCSSTHSLWSSSHSITACSYASLDVNNDMSGWFSTVKA